VDGRLYNEASDHTPIGGPIIDTEEIEERVRRVIAGLGLPHEMVEIDPQYADTAAFCARYGFPMEQSANTIVVGSKKEPKRYCACVVRATRRVDVNHTVRRLLGVSRLSFADPEETRALTGMMLGGVTVFALPPDMAIYVDEGLMPLPWIILGGGSRSLKVKISPEVFRTLPGAVVTPGLVVEP
jgi:prolyl-tRNA editing enzyme YbaK/EbsC (Cys-tRNA(Pro) deacylase)